MSMVTINSSRTRDDAPEPVATMRFSVAILGAACVGKSAIVHRYLDSAAFTEQYDYTIEDLHKATAEVKGQTIQLDILDTAGLENYRHLASRQWMPHKSGFIFVFSLLDRQTFDALDAFLKMLEEIYKGDPPPSIIIANKADAEVASWAVSEEELKKLEQRWTNCQQAFITSAKNNQNITAAFAALSAAMTSQKLQKDRERRDQDQEDPHLEMLAERSCTRRLCRRCRHDCVVL